MKENLLKEFWVKESLLKEFWVKEFWVKANLLKEFWVKASRHLVSLIRHPCPYFQHIPTRTPNQTTSTPHL
jgi:hypothetical protein